MNLIRISAAVIIFSASICLAAGEQSEPTSAAKAATLHQEAQNWIMVGNNQMKKGLYRDAEKSYQAAGEYQDYLSPAEKTKLQENLDKAHKAANESRPVVEHLQKAREYLNQGQPIKARAEFEIVKNSPNLK